MTLPRFTVSLRFAHFSLICIGLMWVLPFLDYRHVSPLTTFREDWLALACGLAALSLLATRRFWQQPEIPRIAWLPFGLLLLVWLQYLLGMLPYYGQALLVSEHLLWAALLIVLGRQLREQLGLSTLTVALAAFLLLGAGLGAMIGVLQYFEWHTIFDWVILPKPESGIIYGNMGQPNHYGSYTMLGLISLGFLSMRGRAPIWQTALLAVPLLFAAAASGSRTTGLYLLCLPVFTWLWQRRDAALRPLFYYTLALLAGYILMSVLLFELGGVSVAERFFGAGAMSARVRLLLWHEAWQIFLQHPLLGAGFGQFGWQHYLLGSVTRDVSLTGLYDNCHNLVMQTAAEMGLAGLLLLIGTLALWIRQFMRAAPSAHGWWGCAVLLMIGTHSLLEYPLWYAFWIGIAALLLGMLDTTAYRPKPSRTGPWTIAVLLLSGIVTLAQMGVEYSKLEREAAIPLFARGKRIGIEEATRWPLLRPYADMIKANVFWVTPDSIEEQLALVKNSLHFWPSGVAAYRHALLLALQNRPDEAKIRMEQAIWAAPYLFPQIQKDLESWVQKDPSHCAALLEFALQKYEEHQRAATSAK